MDNPQLADDLEPLSEPEPSSTQERATMAWGTLMDAKQVILAGYVNNVEFVETLLRMLVEDVAQVGQSGQPPSIERLAGYENVIATITQRVQMIALDPNQKQRVQEYTNLLGQVSNRVKGWVQQQAEAQQSQPQGGGEDAAAVVKAQSQAQIQQALAQQKMEHKNQAFVADQKRKDLALLGESHRAGQRVAVDAAATDARTENQIRTANAKTAATLE
jgi:hypothetical protein